MINKDQLITNQALFLIRPPKAVAMISFSKEQ